MIGKVLSGKSFGGCVRYVMEKPGAEVLLGVGVRIENAKLATLDFNIQRKLRPGLGEAVGHISLNWSKEDMNRLDSKVMEKMAMKYLNGMKITNTQVLLVRHYDAKHPHLHIVYNRVDNNGKTIPDSFLKRRNVEVSQRMTKIHGFYMAEGKDNVKRESLKGNDQVRYMIYDRLKSAIPKSRSFSELEKRLGKDGISVGYKFNGKSNVVQGISFRYGEITFKGSAIDREMSLSAIQQQLGRNLSKSTTEKSNERAQDTLGLDKNQTLSAETHILDTLLRKEHEESESLGLIGRRKKNKPHELGFGL